jgi:hypothetical protein
MWQQHLDAIGHTQIPGLQYQDQYHDGLVTGEVATPS